MQGDPENFLTPRQRSILGYWRQGFTAANVARALGGRETRSSVTGMLKRMREMGVDTSRGAVPVPAPPKPEPPPPEPIPEPEPDAPAWRCRSAGCRGTVQPGRVLCAGCISARAAKLEYRNR